MTRLARVALVVFVVCGCRQDVAVQAGVGGEARTVASALTPGVGIGVAYSSASTSFSLWSPDTSDVVLWVNGTLYPCQPVTVPGYTGVYGVTVPGDLHLAQYHYLVRGVQVRDPYGVMVDNVSKNNVVVDLSRTEPTGGWVARPALANREDAIVYELHVRDFTIDAESGVSAGHRGKFLGVVEAGTRSLSGKATGLDHLKELGVTHVQVMPMYDFQTPMYNWGYDPTNYNVPEEQYAVSQDPVERIRELKTMVNELHRAGLRVVMDVVYNHTYSNDMFSPITPQYFDGLNLSGTGNSIDSGKPMVSRFIQDSLAYWANEYHVDGFRFDLVGVFYYAQADAWARAVNATLPDANLLWYGEPWNGFATDPNEALKVRMGKVPAMADGHFGVFNGNFRQAIKGDNDGTGRGYMFNVVPSWIDAIKAGVRGSIMATKSTNPLPDSWDSMFAYDPEQSVNYISAHDNYCLWDKIVHCGVTGGYAQRIDKFGTAIVLTSQGIPFLHGGDELLRTKVVNGDWSYASNSYNAPDAYNMIHWAWKDANGGVLDYDKGLIALRKAHPVFRMTSWDQVTANATTTTWPGGQVIVNDLNGAAVGDGWSRVLVIYNSGNNLTYTLPAGQWYVAVEKENSAVGGTPVSGSVVAEGTAVTIVYQTSAPPPPPAPPTGLRASASSPTQIDLSWTASSGATSYTVSQALTSGGAPTVVGTTSATSFSATGLTASTSYTYTVTASNAGGTSAPSSAATATTLTPGAGLTLHFKATGPASWSTVNVYYWGSNGSPAANSWPGAAATSQGGGWFTFTVPFASTTNVIFNNGTTQTVDLSRAAEGWFVPTGTSAGKVTGTWYDSNPDATTPPATPTGLTVSATTSSAVSLTWTAVASATSYTVFSASSSAGPFTQATTSTSPSATVSGLSASTTVWLRVTASNAAGQSAPSAAISATTASGGAVTTTVRVNYDVGFGNSMTLRGDTAPLSWTAGVQMTWTSGNVWTWSTTAIAAGTTVQFKPLVNDSKWSNGGNYTVTGGQTVTVTPTFP